jgi:hypothetical protein
VRFTFDLSIRACARPCRRANRTRVFQKTFASPSSFGYPQVPPRIFSSMARPRAPRADSRDACKSPLHRPPLTITTTATPRAWLLRREAEISADIAANQRFVPPHSTDRKHRFPSRTNSCKLPQRVSRHEKTNPTAPVRVLKE